MAAAASSPLKRIDDEEREQQRRSQKVHISLRLTVLGVIILGLFSIMIVRLWSLQVLQSSKYKAEAANISTRKVPISPPRGLILARNGSVVVGDKVEAVVTLNRQVAATDQGVVARLAAELGVTVSQINADLNNQQDSIYEPVPVEVGAPESTIVYLAEHKADFPGVAVSFVAERTYPLGDFAAQALGYVADITAGELKQLSKYGYIASDVIGQSGLEAEYERYLHGRPGMETLQVDAYGDPVGTPKINPPVIGNNVVLNLDVGLQDEVQRALSAQLTTLRSQNLPVNSGAAVVMDPQNGAVLAMVSLPTYNPSWWVGGISEAHYKAITSASSSDPLLNRAIQGLYTPGSTFKLATATAALQDGLISTSTIISDIGGFTIPGCTGSGCRFVNGDGVYLGPIDVQTAISASDDVFFYTLGYRFWQARQQYGDMPIQKVAAAYGWGVSPGVDLPGAAQGQVDSPALRSLQHQLAPKAFPYNYYGVGDNINMAFGQGETLITPLQLANAFATFANGGTRYAPQLAAGIVSPTGKLVKRFTPKVLGHISFNPAIYQTILAGFEGAVTSSVGTSYYTFRGYPYSKLPLAGKTGTATTSNNPLAQPTGLFVAFGPATGSTSAPRYVVAVVIPHAGYGASAAAPVARQIFQYLINHPVGPLDLHPQTAKR